LRNADEVTPATLRRLAADLGADLLVSAALHEVAAEAGAAPVLVVSARAYRDGDDLAWAGYEAHCGLDRRSVLGLGTVDDVAALAARVAAALAADLRARGAAPTGPPPPASPVVALVPFTSAAETDGTAGASAVTEAVRALLDARGVPMASPPCVAESARQLGLVGWGAVPADVRRQLATECGAEWVLTGAVEAYDVELQEGEPLPRVALHLRLVDAESGRVLWIDGGERGGWDGPDFFRLGRTYTRGAVAQRLGGRLLERMWSERRGDRPGGVSSHATP
jgi:TolB-like protein